VYVYPDTDDAVMERRSVDEVVMRVKELFGYKPAMTTNPMGIPLIKTERRLCLGTIETSYGTLIYDPQIHNIDSRNRRGSRLAGKSVHGLVLILCRSEELAEAAVEDANSVPPVEGSFDSFTAIGSEKAKKAWKKVKSLLS